MDALPPSSNKGENLLSTDDTREKANIGRLWAEKSGGKGLFLLVCETREELRFDRQMQSQAIRQ